MTILCHCYIFIVKRFSPSLSLSLSTNQELWTINIEVLLFENHRGPIFSPNCTDFSCRLTNRGLKFLTYKVKDSRSFWVGSRITSTLSHLYSHVWNAAILSLSLSLPSKIRMNKGRAHTGSMAREDLRLGSCQWLESSICHNPEMILG